MVTITKRQTDTGLTVELAGAIEENLNLEKEMGEFKGELLVNCRGVTRINSVGVKTWINYFNGLKRKGLVFSFQFFSPALVAQVNMISNFACGGEIKSVLLPYSCETCKKEFVAPFDTETLKSLQGKIPKVNCGADKCSATFDDDEDYFYFLTN